jgi:hypothetical protein
MIARFRRFVAAESLVTGLPLGWLLVAAAVLHIVVTLRAMAPWNPDEHFQILEFAFARAGHAPASDLPWEYAARVRSSLQPVLAMGVIEGARTIGIESPFLWTRILRLGTLVLAFTVLLRVFARVSPSLTPRGRRVHWLVGLFLWFAPLFTSRFTSENASGLTLALALTFVTRDRDTRSDTWLGLLLGLSFVLRYQTAFASAALVLWVLIYGVEGKRRTLGIVADAMAVVMAGALLDSWFYDGWVITAWQYFQVTIVQGMAAAFGTNPWYAYFGWMVALTPPLGAALLLTVCIAVAAQPRSAWVWATVAFVVGHAAVAHKEPRFLLPLLYVLPVLAAMAWDALGGWRANKMRRWIVYGLAAGNALAAAFLMTPVVHRGSEVREVDWHCFRYLWETAESRPGQTIYVLTEEKSAYRAWFWDAAIYRHPRVQSVPHTPGDSLPALIPRDTRAENILVMTREPAVPRVAGAAGFTLGYEREPGYRILTRWLGDGLGGWVSRTYVGEPWSGGRTVYTLTR